MVDRSKSNSSSIIIVLSALFFLAGGGIGWFAYQLFGAEEDAESVPEISNGILNIHIEKEGIYTLQVNAIEAASNLSIGSWDQHKIALTLQGEPVPFHIQNNNLIFFGVEHDTVYAREQVYQLRFGSAAEGLAVNFSTLDATPTESLPTQQSVTRLAKYEQNERYVSVARTDEWVDTWYWDQIHVSDYFEFEADLPYVTDGSLVLTSHLYGVSHDYQTENDHDLDVVINEKPISQILFDGNKHVVIELPLPPNSIQSGTNLIRFDNRPEGNAFIDISEVDWVELAYDSQPVAQDDAIHFKTEPGTIELDRISEDAVLLALDESRRPVLLQNVTFGRRTATFSLNSAAEVYAAGSDGWLEPNQIVQISATEQQALSPQQADMIIITSPDFVQALEPLVQARQNQGLNVHVALTNDIYNQHGYGQPSPVAIQSFLGDALNNWPKPAPKYLLLAGGTTYDFRNNLATAEQNRIPSIMVPVEHSGETVSDTQLADVDGDQRADISVGRWPVNTAEEVSSLVARTLAYEQAPAADSLLFTADGTSGEFGHTSDRLIEVSNLNAFDPRRAYGATWQEVTDLWNGGNWIVTYVGHGSVDLWGSEEILSNERIPGLTNPGDKAPPIVLQFTCLTGFFAHPSQPSISQEMLLNENGPVLTVSASSLTYSSSQEPFAEGMLVNLTDPSFTRIGDAIADAREKLDISNPSVKEVYDTFNLLGDPSAIIVRP